MNKFWLQKEPNIINDNSGNNTIKNSEKKIKTKKGKKAKGCPSCP